MNNPNRPEAIDSYPLAPTQAGMVYHAISDAHTGVDIEQIVIEWQDRLDQRLFDLAWRQVTRRHTILRTRFKWEGIPEFRQEVVEDIEIPLTIADWSEFDPARAQSRLETWLAADRREDFDLAEAPLMRLFIARLGAQSHRVVWTFHHALLDGRSFARVLREVFVLYDASLRPAAPPPQLPTPRPYREYIASQQSLEWSASESYWRAVLSGFHAATPFAVDSPVSATPGAETAGVSFDARQVRLSQTTTSALRSAAIEIGVTVNNLLLAAWAILLRRYGGESDIVFGATRADRHANFDSAEGVVGLFINTLPIRIQVDDDRHVVEWLQALRQQLVQMRPHENAPLVKIQSWSSVARGKPLFESLVVYDHQSLDTRMQAPGDGSRRRRFEYIGQTNYPLTVIAYGDDEMLLRIEFSQQRFSGIVIERMLGHLVNLLTDLAHGESRQVKDLKLVGATERATLLASSVGERVYPRGPALHELFERQVERTPEAIALTAFESEDARIELSYAELNRRANVVAHRLRTLGVVPNQLVGLRTERNAELVIGILAILKSGGAYLPLDPVYPKERVAFMLEDSQVGVVLTQTSLKAELADFDVSVICLDQPTASAATVEANPPSVNAADDLAYVIYTSGSTGKPKGVRITHHNVSRLFTATDHWYGFNEHDVWPLFHSYAFDVSVWEFWGAFLHGGRLIAVPYWVSRSPEAFRELVVKERVTVLNQTPSAFQQYLQGELAQRSADHALRFIIFAGEALELQSLRPWFDRYGDAKPVLVNKYGITETTVHVSYRPITLADLDAAAGSVIGVPIPDLKIYILDPHGEPTPIGVAGEMFVAGAGVGLGYLNRPELSAQRFLRDPFDANPAARMYRSGDLARRLDNGDIEYLGRMDQQVKIRGFRIELGEIEAVISQHPLVRQVAVLAREDVPGDKRLVAYMVGAEPQTQIVEQLRQSIRAVMPDYMMPAHFVFVPALPLTANGKLDRKALPAPASLRSDSVKPFVAPRNAVEQALAKVWKAVLRVDRVSIEDHFFELGGDSILSIQVIARCRQQGLQFTPKDLFSRPTIAELAQVVRTAATAAKAASAPVSGEVMLTPIQHWFFEQAFVNAHHWNQAFMFVVPAKLDSQALDLAMRRLQSRHAELRLRYHQSGDGHWTQTYGNDDSPVPLRFVDLSAVATHDRSAAIESHASAEQSSFDLASGPLWRALHFNLGPDAPGRLLLAVHHLVVDGVSWRTLREDLESLYFQVTSGGLAEPVPDQTSSMQAWAKALCRHAQSAAVQNTFPYWHTLAGKPGLTLPHHAAGQTPFAATGLLVTRLSRDETRALLQQVPALFQSQINDALLMALSKALHDSTGSRTLRIDLEGHGREHIDDSLDVSRTIGWFTSLFPIALDVEPGGDTVDLLLSVKDQLQRVPDRGLSYGLLRYLSDDAKTRDALAGTAASPVLFNYLGQFDAVVTDSALFSFATESTGPWRSPGARRTHALEIVSLVRDGQLEMAWHHDAEAHHAASIAQLAKGMLDALIDLTARADPSRRRAATPADFPLAQLDAASLARLGSRFPQLQDVYPLTPMQRLFFAMESSSGNLGFEQWHFRLDGAVDGERLKRAIGHVIERHPILRTAVVAEGGAEPLQVVSSGVVLPWSDEDWRDLPAAAQSQRLAELLASDTAAGFDLAQAPLMRVALRRVADESAHLIWSTHHLCIDGWSWPIVFADVSRAYSALEAGREVLFETAAPYRRYVEWLAHSAPQSEAFWKAQLAPFDAPTPLPLRAPSAAEMTPSDETFTDVVVSLPATITNELQAWARGSRVTLSAVFNAAWSLVLGHYSAAEHVVFGAAFSGRPAEIEGIESLVGSCVNNLPMRVKVEPATPLGAWLTEIQQLQFDIAQHQYAPLEQIQQWAAIPWRHRLFDSLVVFQNYQVDADARRIGANVHSTLLSAPEATNYALTLAVAVEAQLRIRLLFKPGVLARADVARIADDLITVLSTMAGRAKATVGDILALLPAESRGQARAAASVRTAARRRALYSAPSSVAEREIAAVWQDLFGVDQVSLDDNFFDLGGHSMLLVQAHARLKVSLRTDLPIVALLQFPTVRSLARHLSRDAAADGAKASSAATDRARLQREGQMRQKSIAGRRQQP